MSAPSPSSVEWGFSQEISSGDHRPHLTEEVMSMRHEHLAVPQTGGQRR